MVSSKEEVLLILWDNNNNLVPRQGKGIARGESLGPPGMFNDPYAFNVNVHDQPAVKIQVDNVEAKIHKEFMNCNHIYLFFIECF